MPLLLAACLIFLLVASGDPEAIRADLSPAARVEADLQEKATSRQLATVFSPETLLWIETPNLSEFAQQGARHSFLQAFENSELGKRVLRDEEGDSFSLRQLQRYARSELGFDPLKLLARASRSGLAFGLEADAEGLTWTLVARAESADEADGISRQLHGYVDELEWTCLGDTLVFSDRADTLERALRRLQAGNEAQPALRENPAFQEALESSSGAPLLRAFVDLRKLEQLASNSGESGLDELRAIAEDAGAHVFLGRDVAMASRSATSLLAEMHVEDRTLALRLKLLGTQGSALPTQPCEVPRASSEDVARGVLHRDIEALFTERSQLFDSQALAGFNEFADNAALFLGGADFERDILPGLSKSIGFVARKVQYEGGPRPQVELPGLALLFQLEDPERLGPHLSSAFQSAVALASVDRAQEGLPPLLLDLELVEGTPMTSARFLPPLSGEVVDVRFNLEPACARTDNLFVLGTHAEVVRSVVADLRHGRTEALSLQDCSSHIELSGPSAAELFQANLETLIMNQVLDEGVSSEEAREELGWVHDILRSLEGLEVQAGTQKDGCVEIRASVTWGEGR